MSTTKTYKSVRCPICNTPCIVWRRKGLKASLLRKLALADHVNTSHPSVVKSSSPHRKDSI